LFENPVAVSSWTWPSTATILTGGNADFDVLARILKREI